MPTNQPTPPERPTIDDRTPPEQSPTATQKPPQTPVAAHQRPDWMTDDWLREQVADTKGCIGAWGGTCAAYAREILRLRAELARWQAAPPWRAALATAEADRDLHRQRADRAEAEVASVEHILGHYVKLSEELGRPFGHDVSDWMRDVVKERDAAIRDRNEFAASEVEWFAAEMDNRAVEQLGRARAAELRKAAPAAAPHIFDVTDGRVKPLEPFAPAAAPAEPEWRDCETREGSGAIDQRLSAYSDSAVVECPDCDGAKGHAAAPALPRRECRAVDVSAPICTTPPADLHQSAADLHQSTPAADAHRYTDDDLLAIEGQASEEGSVDVLRGWSQRLATDLHATRARLAAAEKAKAELVAAIHPVLAKIEPKPSPFQPLLVALVKAVEAAERAGGAS